MTSKIIPAKQAQETANKVTHRMDQKLKEQLELISMRIGRASANGAKELSIELSGTSLTMPIIDELEAAGYTVYPHIKSKQFGIVQALYITWKD